MILGTVNPWMSCFFPSVLGTETTHPSLAEVSRPPTPPTLKGTLATTWPRSCSPGMPSKNIACEHPESKKYSLVLFSPG